MSPLADDSALESVLIQAISRHDRPGAVALVMDALADQRVSIPDLFDFLSEFLVEIGSGWQRGVTEVWQEHLVTGIVRNIVEACGMEVEDQAPQQRGSTVALAAPADEYHDLGLRMLADRFALAGWRPHFLGGNLPLGQLLTAVSTLGADAVALTASTHFHRLSLRDYVQKLQDSNPDIRVWVGGAAFAKEHVGWPEEMVIDPRAISSPGDT